MTGEWDTAASDRVPSWLVFSAVAAVALLAGVIAVRGEAPADIPVDTAASEGVMPPHHGVTDIERVRVAGVDLVTDGSALRECSQAATLTGHAIPCLPLRPTGGESTACVDSCLRGGGYVTSLRRFQVPSRWCEGCVPEVVIAAAPADAPSLVSALTACDPRSPTVGRRGALLECREEPASWAGLAPHAGNTLRRGSGRGVVYAVSSDGHGQAQAALVNHVFDSLVLVGG